MKTAPGNINRVLLRLLPCLLAGFAALFLSACALPGDSGGYVWKEGESTFIAGEDDPTGTGSPLPSRGQAGVPGGYSGPSVSKQDFPPIYFRYDSFAIPKTEVTKLTSAITQLKNSDDRLIVAGFTDERGTEEYNRALGSKRAQSVRDYLIANGGIDAGRIDTVSFGEDLPAATGSGPAVWAKNRRAELGLVR
jgi:peptidoglycan-associated lipoprotein